MEFFRVYVDNHSFAVYQEPPALLTKGLGSVGLPDKFQVEFLWAAGLLGCPLGAAECFHRPGPKLGNPIILLHRSLRTWAGGCALIKIWKGNNNVDEQRRDTEQEGTWRRGLAVGSMSPESSVCPCEGAALKLLLDEKPALQYK